MTDQAEASEGLEKAETLIEDIAEFIMAEIKRPEAAFGDLDDFNQSLIIDRVRDRAEAIVYEALKIVHAEGAPSLRAIVGMVKFDKMVSTQLAIAKTERHVDLLTHLSNGGEVLVVMDNMAKYDAPKPEAEAPAAASEETTPAAAQNDQHQDDQNDRPPGSEQGQSGAGQQG